MRMKMDQLCDKVSKRTKIDRANVREEESYSELSSGQVSIKSKLTKRSSLSNVNLPLEVVLAMLPDSAHPKSKSNGGPRRGGTAERSNVLLRIATMAVKWIKLSSFQCKSIIEIMQADILASRRNQRTRGI